jgi:predicted nucleic acid-binding protein
VIVLDASAVLEWLLRLPAAGLVEDRMARAATLHAPHLLDLEVAQVLRRFERAGALDPGRGAQALADLADLPLERYPHDLFLPRIWSLRDNVTAYDGCYLALAEALRAPLVTCDARLAGVPGHGAVVEVLASPS